MYLSDTDIRTLLPDMQLKCPDPAHGFDPATQIQPCSIDLRVSNVFWERSRRRRLWRRVMRRDHAIDLRRSAIEAIDPLRDWKRRDLNEGDTVTVHPNQVVMGRIYERFRVPPGFAGKIEGRSSFARLGLMVHCTADFINPGWEGFMPLQFYNAGPYPIRLTPYLPICQLMLVPLSSKSERIYPDQELQSKYDNDDGGPSLWWVDARIRALQQRLRSVSTTSRMQQDVLDRVRPQSTEVLERFQGFVDRRRTADMENADRLLDDFAKREDRARRIDEGSLWAAPIFAGTFLGSLFATDFVWAHIAVGLLTVVSLALALKGYVRRDGGYFGKAELSTTSTRPPSGS